MRKLVGKPEEGYSAKDHRHLVEKWTEVWEKNGNTAFW
jgi:hypothetical protein